MVAVIAVSLGWFALSGGPQIGRSAKIVRLSQDASAKMLEEQSILRAYVVTGDRSTLAAYPRVRDQISADFAELAGNLNGARATSLVRQFGTSELAWQTGWAATAADPSTRIGFLAATTGTCVRTLSEGSYAAAARRSATRSKLRMTSSMRQPRRKVATATLPSSSSS